MTAMEKSVTIRFSHIDVAGIVFYPRYFEILSELYPDLPFAEAPFALETRFLKPNYLGDEIGVIYDRDKQSFTGRKGDVTHFTISALPHAENALAATAHRPDQTAFRSNPMGMAPWVTDCTGHLQVSRYFELLNFAVEQWFSRSLAMPFRHLHTERGWGMPTVVIRTRCRELPRAGETVDIRIRPTRIGGKSLTYTCWLVRDDECLIENEQTVVFIRFRGSQFETISIPAELRARLQDSHVAA